MSGAMSRTAVVQAARVLLARDSKGGLSLRRLAAHLRVTASTLYSYVDNKDDLLRAVLEHELRGLSEQLAAPQHAHPVVRLYAMSQAYVAHVCANAGLFRALLLSVSEDPAMHATFQRTLTRTFDVALLPIGDALEHGYLRAADAHEIHRTLWTALHGATVVLLLSDMAADLRAQRYASAVLDAVMRGLCTESGAWGLERART